MPEEYIVSGTNLTVCGVGFITLLPTFWPSRRYFSSRGYIFVLDLFLRYEFCFHSESRLLEILEKFYVNFGIRRTTFQKCSKKIFEICKDVFLRGYSRLNRNLRTLFEAE